MILLSDSKDSNLKGEFMSTEREIVICDKCGKAFIKEMIYYFGSVDENRKSSFYCPYCGETYPIRLRSCEDVTSRPLDNV